MKKKKYECPIRMWCDVAVVSIPLVSIGIACNLTSALWWAAGFFGVGLIGVGVSLYYMFKDRPLNETPISKDISMAATYVWPCILSGMIFEYFGNDPLPFYILAGFAMAVILFVNHYDFL